MITVLGAGAFGTGLAMAMVQNGPVTLWARDAEHAREMADTRENRKRLPGVTLPEPIEVTAELILRPARHVYLLAVPMQKLRHALEDHKTVLAGQTLVACCKGIELGTALSATAVISEVIPDAQPAILTGPSFAADIARGLPTALTLACARMRGWARPFKTPWVRPRSGSIEQRMSPGPSLAGP